MRLTHYVDITCDGDKTKILSSGFIESKQPTPFYKLPLVVLNDDHLGEVKCSGKQHTKGRACIWQIF